MLSALLSLFLFTAHAADFRAVEAPRGARAVPAAPVAVPSLPSYLSVANPADRAWVAQIIQAAQASPTARKELLKVEQAVIARGRPVIVEVVKQPEAGAYNFDWDALSLRRKDQKYGAKASVSTLIHELRHFMQKDLPVPSDLLETEIESYVIDFKVMKELRDKPRRGSYDERAHNAFKKGVPEFVKFLEKEYPEDQAFYNRRTSQYRRETAKNLEEAKAERRALESQKRERLAVIEQMRSVGHPKTLIDQYREDTVDPLDAKLVDVRRAISWATKDLAMLASPDTRAAARRYARNVIRRARRFQKVFARS